MPKVQQHAAGGAGRGRRGRSAHVATSLAEINVVPLVDVMLVLLIIFMVTAPMLQQGLEVNLPQAKRARALNVQPVYVTVPADFSTRRVVQVDKDEVKVEIMHERVRQALLTRDDKSVYIRADGAASVQDLMTVTDKLREAGVDKVGLMSKPVERR
jgi:biopolymer transport protein TolR